MEIERVFMSCFFIEKKPDDIFTLAEAALQVGASKYPQQFQKRKKRIIKFLMDPSDDFILDDDEEEEEEEEGMGVGDEDEVTNAEEKEESEKEKQIHAESKKPLMKKIKVAINKTVQVASMKKKNNCSATTENVMELKETSETDDLVQQQLDDADKQGTPQSHNTTTMASRKRMSMNMSTKRVEVAPPREKQLCSFKKKLEGDEQIQKQSHKDNFKKMENDHDTEKKRGEGSQQTPTQRGSGVNTKSMPHPPPLMMMNVAAKPVEGAHKKQLSDCSPQKQSNCSSITRPAQKETKSITDKKKFESSKRKFEERLAEQREAKRRIVMVDFHDMPKPANDPRAPKHCWDRRKRF